VQTTAETIRPGRVQAVRLVEPLARLPDLARAARRGGTAARDAVNRA
jgi:hypothetical protein